MKNIFKELSFYVIPIAIAYLAAYLIGSFIAASFDMQMWDRPLRVVMAVAGWVYGVALILRLTYARKNNWSMP